MHSRSAPDHGAGEENEGDLERAGHHGVRGVGNAGSGQFGSTTLPTVFCGSQAGIAGLPPFSARRCSRAPDT
jgi:hypothetical protein